MDFVTFDDEYSYRLLENLGIMCGDQAPTKEQLEVARKEAWAKALEVETMMSGRSRMNSEVTGKSERD